MSSAGPAIDIVPRGLVPRAATAAPIPTQLRVWNADGTHLLEVNGTSLAVSIPDGALASPDALVDAVERQLGLHVALVRAAAADVAEVALDGDAGNLPRASWRPATPSDGRAPWQHPGWLRRTVETADRLLDRIGRPRSGDAQQMRHTSLTALLRLPTARGPVWLKAVPPAFAHEPVVIRFVNEIAPGTAPHVLATCDGFWLAEEFPRECAGPTEDVLAHLARVQIASVARLDELRRLGCPERNVEMLLGDLAGLIDGDALDEQARERLRASLPAVMRAAQRAHAMPPTLVHGDVSPGNVRATRAGPFVYDWTDACIAHPFLELASPLGYEADDARAQARARIFADEWRKAAADAAVTAALAGAPVLGAAHQAATYARLLQIVDPSAADQAGGAALRRFLRYWVGRLCDAAGS